MWNYKRRAMTMLRIIWSLQSLEYLNEYNFFKYEEIEKHL